MELNLEVVLDYYTKVTRDYDSGTVHPPEVILPPVPEVRDGCTTPPSPFQYLLPSVILWDPLQQLDSFKEGMQCPFSAHTDEEECFLEPKKSRQGDYWWQAGLRISLTPRQLSSSSWPTVLLSRIYFCNSKIKHKTYIAHDPEILSKIPASESHKIPFILLHRTGFTKELCETVTSLAASGMHLEDVEQVIYQQHITNFAQCKAKFEEDKHLCLQNAGLEVEETPVIFPDYKPVCLPSMEIILGSLLENFQERQVYYHQRMSELSAEVLLMGHFFKASQQMGAMGADGKKWVPMYNHVFAIMNEKGQAIAWQVTKGTSINDVCALIENVYQRLTRRGVTIKLVLMPDCCKQKDMVTSIFGSNVQVKMDPHFAHRRLEKRFKIRKGDHDHAVTCLQDFNLVFHKSTDLNVERNEETPSSEMILGNLNSFISQWKIVRGETHERLLHDPALRELEAIKCSVSRGCLSDIPPSSGAKYVKDLREYLKPILHKRFLTADLALPALTVLLYCWNENHNDTEVFIPINSYKSALDATTYIPTSETFGCIEEDIQNGNKEIELCDFAQHLYSYQSHMFPLLWGIEEDCSSNSEPFMTTNSQKLNSTVLSKVLSQIENNELILQNLKSVSPENVSAVNIWHCHLLPCCTQIFSRCNYEVQDDTSNVDQLQNNLEMFGGTIVNPQVNDADGFFTALALGLKSILVSLETENITEFIQVKEHLNSLGYKVDESKGDAESDNVVILRQIISTEWLQNKDKYSNLLTSSLLDFTQEAELFTHKGYCQTEMINLLPIAAVKVLRLSLIIFTSMEHFPIVPVVFAEKLLTSKCLYIGYSAVGYGSYYPVTITPLPTVEAPEKPKNVCRCGLGNSKNKKERRFCVQVAGTYLTRCECFRSGEACNYLCRCFNCANPKGTSTESRASHTVTSQKTRLRTRHKLQQMKTKPCPRTSWSEKECLAFEFLIDAMQFSHGITSFSEITPDMVEEEYHNLQQFCEGKTLLKPMSLDDVKEHFKIFSSSLERFKALLRKQTEKHWNQSINHVSLDILDTNQLVVIVESSE